MYDAKAEAREFVADSRGEAVAQACEFFGEEESALEIRQPPETEVSGLGGRVLVVAFVKGRERPRGGREERGDRSERGDRGNRGERGGRGERRGRRERGDRGERRERSERGDQAPRASEAPPSAPRASEASVEGELSEIGDFVKGALERMGLGSFEISETGEEAFVIVEVRGEGARALASGDGRAADALQLLANQFATQRDEDAPRVVVDVESDPERRESRLTRLAERAARRASDTGRSIALDPMNPRDRRIVHVALRDAEDVATMSIGEGRYRQVVVAPEGSPDYEEARKASDAAASRDS